MGHVAAAVVPSGGHGGGGDWRHSAGRRSLGRPLLDRRASLPSPHPRVSFRRQCNARTDGRRIGEGNKADGGDVSFSKSVSGCVKESETYNMDLVR